MSWSRCWVSQRWPKAVLDLANPMLERDMMQERLLPLLQATRGGSSEGWAIWVAILLN